MDRENAMAQNLRDAGCDRGCVERFLQAFRAQRTAEQLQILSRHRGQLLGDIHAGQKKLDCLDFLIYQIRKEQKHD